MRNQVTARQGRSAVRWLGLLLAAIVALAGVGWWSGAAHADEGNGTPVAGQRVYDRAGVLSAAEIAELERHAAAVERAGAPVVVYLQRRAADRDATDADARDLMTAWAVESAPGQRDGVVLFLNLKPADPRHGEAVIYAGQTLVRDGRLPQRELQRIFDDSMRGPLRDGQLAAGIAAGLDAVANTLTVGPPPPSAVEVAARDLAELPMNLLALVLTAGLGWLAWSRSRRPFETPLPAAPVTVPPAQLEPALAGALLNGRVGNQLVEATVLDLAARGALAIEPAGRAGVQLRPLHAELVRTPFEGAVWQALAESADSSGLVPPKHLGQLPGRWGPARTALTDELVRRGWFDPAVHRRRNPLYLAAVGAFALAVAAFVVTVVGEAGLGLVAVGLLVSGGVACWLAGYGISGTTAEGEAVAAAWRGYRDGLRQASRDEAVPLDLDTALPYAVAFGTTGDLNRRLKAASRLGYTPAWFHVAVAEAGQAQGHANGAFFVYWTAFHAGVNPSSSGSSAGGGAGAGGASGGGSF